MDSYYYHDVQNTRITGGRRGPRIRGFPWSVAPVLLLVLVGRVPAQAPVSWDEARVNRILAENCDGRACAKGELIVVLNEIQAIDKLRAVADSLGDRLAGFIPRLAAARIVVARDVQLAPRLQFYSSLVFVRRVEPNVVGVLNAIEDDFQAPNDPGFPDQWHLANKGQSGGKLDADIDADPAWLITRGSPEITVAVLDTGIDLDSPEFSQRLLPGWDFYGEDSEPEAVFPHGTQVAGLLGANASNMFEVAGVDHECMILPIKIGNLTNFTEFDVVQGVDFAAGAGAHIISMSLKFPPPLPQLLDEAVALAASSGAIVVAGAGNTGTLGSADKTWPAASEHTISVGWTDHNDWRSVKSSAGDTLDFVAPGEDVFTVSATATGDPKEFSGASAATPIVSGIVALMKSLNSSLTYEQVYDLLSVGAEDQLGDPLDTLGWDPWYGHGRVNAHASLQALCGCTGGERLIASPQQIPGASGGIIEFVIDFGRDFAHKPYLTLGSATSGSGGFSMGGTTLRLIPDEYLSKTLGGSDGVALIDTSGILDALGRAHAMIIVEALPSGSAGLTLFHQAVVLEEATGGGRAVVAISNKTQTVVQGP